MGKDQRLRYSKKETKENVKMVFTHGKKKTAVANAVVARGTGVITVNRIPIQNVEPKNLRIKITTLTDRLKEKTKLLDNIIKLDHLYLIITIH